jgi:hypothetical protein
MVFELRKQDRTWGAGGACLFPADATTTFGFVVVGFGGTVGWSHFLFNISNLNLQKNILNLYKVIETCMHYGQRDSLTKISYAFIGTVVKLKFFCICFTLTILKNINVFRSNFRLKDVTQSFLIKSLFFNDSCYSSDGSSWEILQE